MQSHALIVWLDGNHEEAVGLGREDGLPFVVTAMNKSWIPINHLVFAKDGEDAIKIIKDGLKEIVERDYRSTPGAGLHYQTIIPKEQFDRYMKLEWSALPYDKRFVSKVQWAGNSTLL